MASTLRRSDPKLSAILLKNYSYIHSDGIQESLAGTPLQIEGYSYDISSQSLLTKDNFKPLLCCVLNACCQHKFLLADRILTAMSACFTLSPQLYHSLVDDEFINNMELLFENICKIKDWDRSVPCVRLLNSCCQTMLKHHRRGNLDRIYRRVIRKICNSIAKYHITIDEKGSNTTFELRNLYESVVFLRTFLLLLLSIGINFYVDIEPFRRSMRDAKTLVVIAIARQLAFGESKIWTPMDLDYSPIIKPAVWRTAKIHITFTDRNMMDREITLWEEDDGIVSFSHTAATIIPRRALELVIELPLISCIDVHEEPNRLVFYFDVNLVYLKQNLPNILSNGFRNEIAQQYRFSLSCDKSSCIKSLEYDAAVMNFHVVKSSMPSFATNRSSIERYISEDQSTAPSTLQQPKSSYAIIELPLTSIISSGTCDGYGRREFATPHKIHMGEQHMVPLYRDIHTSGCTEGTPVVPRSINKVTTIRTIGTPQADDEQKTIQSHKALNMMAQDFKKISLAIIELPQEEACMGTPVEMIMQRISISPPAPEQMQESGNDPVHISDILNKEMEVPLSTSTKVQDEPTISNTENQNNASEIHIMMPKLIYRGKRIIKKTKRKASDKKNKTKVETPIPTRNYGTRCCINRETNTPSPQSIVKHLKRATQLLMKRKKQTCEYIRREFDELRHTIETRFHLVLCRRQERWNRINMTYVKRLDDITNGVEEDFKIPRLNELVKRLPEPIRLQPIPEIDLCMSTIQTTMCDQNGNMAMK